MSEPTVGLALIVKDEEETLPNLLASIEGAFDQVVLVDTGCKDRTVEVFEQWASGQTLKLGFRVDTFTWIDDFAAARTFADSLLQTEWRVWADADDVIRGSQNLRQLAAEADPDVAGFVCGYDYARDENGNCLCYLRRERLVRAGVGRWDGPVHEAQHIPGRMVEVPAEVVEWVHGKDGGHEASNKRNLRILRKWAKREPENPRVLAYLGTEELTRGKHKRAMPHFRRYLRLKTGWDEERAQVYRKLAICYATEGEHRKAVDLALESIEFMPAWPDAYLTLAENYHQLGEFAKAAHWAREVLERGQPETLLIINPLDYTFQPRLMLASSLGALGQFDEAIEMAEQALSICPDHEPLRETYAEWRGIRKREATAETFIMAAQQLVAHDEQLKALTLLEETVPYFARDHHKIVRARSELRQHLAPILDPERYADHYADGAKPEVLVADDQVDQVAGALPRCRFLLSGLLEQTGVTA